MFQFSSGHLIIYVILRIEFGIGFLFSAGFKWGRGCQILHFQDYFYFKFLWSSCFNLSKFPLVLIVFNVYLVFIDFCVFSWHPTYASLPLLLKHGNIYIFQYQQGINQKKTKKNKKIYIYAKIPKNEINFSVLS